MIVENKSVDTRPCWFIEPLSVTPRSLSRLDSLIMPQPVDGDDKKAATICARATPQSHAKHANHSCSSWWTRS